MADLWKDGDIITAEKLNKMMVFAPYGDSNELLLTPEEIFDDNNHIIYPIIFIVYLGS